MATQKREQILQAAIDVLREDGFAAFTQPRVAARAKLRQSHITYYFPTRIELLHAVADLAVRQRVEALRAIAAVSTAELKIAVLARVLADREQTRVLVALTQSADGDPSVQREFATLGRDVLPITTELLSSAGITATPNILALLQSAGTGISVMLLAADPPDAQYRAEQLLTTLLTSIRLAQSITTPAP